LTPNNPVDVKRAAMRSVLRNLHRLVVEAPPKTVRKVAETARALFRDHDAACKALRACGERSERLFCSSFFVLSRLDIYLTPNTRSLFHLSTR
jgi:hypothetical protein